MTKLVIYCSVVRALVATNIRVRVGKHFVDTSVVFGKRRQQILKG